MQLGQADGYLGRIGQLNLRPEKKQKRQKKETTIRFILDRKTKYRKQPSTVAKWLSEIIKRDLRSGVEIEKFLSDNKINVDAKTQKLYKTIVDSKVVNGNLVLSDQLTNQPLILLVNGRGFKGYCFSNDKLYLNYLYQTALAGVGGVIPTYAAKGTLISAHVCSLPFSLTGQVKKGYYQDFDSRFAAIGLNNMSEDERNRILNREVNAQNFMIGNAQYVIYGNNRGCMIFPNTNEYTAEKCKQLYNAQKILSTSTKVGMNEKSLDFEDKVKFIDMELKPETFCPAYVYFPVEFECEILFKVKIDYNQLFQIMNQNYANNNNLVKTLFVWETMYSFFDFIGIFAATSPTLNQQSKEFYAGIYTDYIKIKPYMSAWRKIQIEAQKYIIEFYNSFTTKINFDKLMNLKEKIDIYIKEREALENDMSFAEVKALLEKTKNMGEIPNRQITKEFFDIMLKLRQFINSITLANVSDETVNTLLDFGRLIQQITLSTTKNGNIMIPTIVSPGAFLGNVFKDGNVNTDYVTEFINKIKEQANNRDERRENAVDLSINIINRLPALREQAAIQSVRKNSTEKGYQFSDENIAHLAALALNRIALIKIDNDELNKLIMQKYYREGNINNFVFTHPEINRLVDELAAQLARQAQNKQNAINEIDTKQRELEAEKKRIESTVISTDATVVNNPNLQTDEYSEQGIYTGGNLRSDSSLKQGQGFFGNPFKKVFNITKDKKDAKGEKKPFLQKINDDNFPLKSLNIAKVWYSDILKNSNPNMSGLEQVANFIKNLTLENITSQYPLSEDAVRAIMADYSIKPVEDYIQQGEYKSKRFMATGINYTNKEELNKRMAELGIKSTGGRQYLLSEHIPLKK